MELTLKYVNRVAYLKALRKVGIGGMEPLVNFSKA
jgi:hypothetical protein